MSGGPGFYRGTTHDQMPFFADKEKKMIASKKWPQEYSLPVDMSKVSIAVLRPWIAKRITELLGVEDDIVIDFCIQQLSEIKDAVGNPLPVCPKKLQISLTGFMAKQAGVFVRELWNLLLSAQDMQSGIPKPFLDETAAGIAEKKKEAERISQEIEKLTAAQKEPSGISGAPADSVPNVSPSAEKAEGAASGENPATGAFAARRDEASRSSSPSHGRRRGQSRSPSRDRFNRRTSPAADRRGTSSSRSLQRRSRRISESPRYRHNSVSPGPRFHDRRAFRRRATNRGDDGRVPWFEKYTDRRRPHHWAAGGDGPHSYRGRRDGIRGRYRRSTSPSMGRRHRVTRRFPPNRDHVGPPSGEGGPYSPEHRTDRGPYRRYRKESPRKIQRIASQDSFSSASRSSVSRRRRVGDLGRSRSPSHTLSTRSVSPSARSRQKSPRMSPAKSPTRAVDPKERSNYDKGSAKVAVCGKSLEGSRSPSLVAASGLVETTRDPPAEHHSEREHYIRRHDSPPGPECHSRRIHDRIRSPQRDSISPRRPFHHERRRPTPPRFAHGRRSYESPSRRYQQERSPSRDTMRSRPYPQNRHGRKTSPSGERFGTGHGSIVAEATNIASVEVAVQETTSPTGNGTMTRRPRGIPRGSMYADALDFQRVRSRSPSANNIASCNVDESFRRSEGPGSSPEDVSRGLGVQAADAEPLMRNDTPSTNSENSITGSKRLSHNASREELRERARAVVSRSRTVPESEAPLSPSPKRHRVDDEPSARAHESLEESREREIRASKQNTDAFADCDEGKSADLNVLKERARRYMKKSSNL